MPNLHLAKYVILFIDSSFAMSEAQRQIAQSGAQHGARVVSQEWVLESLAKDKLLPIEPYLLRPPSVKAVPSQDQAAPLHPAQFGPVADLIVRDDVDRPVKRKRSESKSEHELAPHNERSSAVAVDTLGDVKQE